MFQLLPALLSLPVLASAALQAEARPAPVDGPSAQTNIFPPAVLDALNEPGHPFLDDPVLRRQIATTHKDDLLRKRATVGPTFPIGEPADCKEYKTKFFPQWLDHVGPNRQKWQQQYQLVTDFYKPGGPIFLFQSDEAYKMDCIEETMMLDWAKQTNGIAAVLEHRFFGMSYPFGTPNKTFTPEGFNYLTVENIIGDAEEFVAQIKRNVTGAANARVAVASGSYGGYLVTLFYQNSKSFDAVVASAAPIRSIGTGGPNGPNDANPWKYNWFSWVTQVYEQNSPELAEHIATAFDALGARVAANQTKTLQQDLGICKPWNTTVNPSTYYMIFAYTFMFAVEFNYPFENFGRTSLPKPLNTFITQLNKNWDPKHPLNLIRDSIHLWYNPLGYDCIDPFTIGSGGVPIIESTPYGYVQCNIFPQSSSDMNRNMSLFLETVGFAGLPPACLARYNKTTPTMQGLFQKFHYSPAELDASTGIIFAQGGFDPATSLSVPQDFRAPRPLSYDSQRMFVSNMAHREDLFNNRPGDRQTVRNLRKQELATIMRWFEMLDAGAVSRTQPVAKGKMAEKFAKKFADHDLTDL